MNKKTRVTDLTGLNKTLLPKLRFPDFQEEWGSEKLGNISFFVNERVSLEKLSLDTYISTENILPDYEGVTKASKLPPSGSAIQYKKDDILISNIRPYLKKVWFSNKDGGASNDVIIVRAKEKIAPKYLSFMLINDVFIEYVMNGAKGVKMPRGDIFLMKEFPLAYPSIPEQQKIADCLTSLDDLIAAQSQKVAALQAYKKGLLQNLFPAEGESVPRLRFPEFESAGGWEEKEIGAVAKVTTGDKDTQNKVDDGKYPFFVRSQNVERINSFSYDGEAILTSGDGVGVGKNFHYIVGKFDFHQRVYCICDFDDTVYGKFVYYYFSEHFYKRAMQMSAKNSVDSVRMAMITEMPILLPDFREQQRIAELLTALDEQISVQGEALAALKVHKRGLMQGLFP